MSPCIVYLPARRSPTSFLRHGGSLGPFVSGTASVLVFFIRALKGRFDSRPLQRGLQLAHGVLRVVTLVSSRLGESLLLRQASTVIRVPIAALRGRLGDSRPGASLSSTRPIALPSPGNRFSRELRGGVFFTVVGGIRLLGNGLDSFLPCFFPSS